MFETEVVLAKSIYGSAKSRGIIEISFQYFFNMKVCCVFSLESPHRGDSNKYTQSTIFNINRIITQNIPNLQLWDFYRGIPERIRTAMVNEPSVFEPLKVYCILETLVITEISC